MAGGGVFWHSEQCHERCKERRKRERTRARPWPANRQLGRRRRGCHVSQRSVLPVTSPQPLLPPPPLPILNRAWPWIACSGRQCCGRQFWRLISAWRIRTAFLSPTPPLGEGQQQPRRWRHPIFFFYFLALKAATLVGWARGRAARRGAARE